MVLPRAKNHGGAFRNRRQDTRPTPCQSLVVVLVLVIDNGAVEDEDEDDLVPAAPG